eukprot:TRINITY_DN5325_c0_g1_i1.p1 TRINITY_DN5325_c0_g1~~TRINITY_DN5325_c0_g1_i1.p1  ORF type:complete len:629 (+),score=99.86 TRINITY_DN5325_c0_g1_i1:95-1888(+)
MAARPRVPPVAAAQAAAVGRLRSGGGGGSGGVRRSASADLATMRQVSASSTASGSERSDRGRIGGPAFAVGERFAPARTQGGGLQSSSSAASVAGANAVRALRRSPWAPQAAGGSATRVASGASATAPATNGTSQRPATRLPLTARGVSAGRSSVCQTPSPRAGHVRSSSARSANDDDRGGRLRGASAAAAAASASTPSGGSERGRDSDRSSRRSEQRRGSASSWQAAGPCLEALGCLTPLRDALCSALGLPRSQWGGPVRIPPNLPPPPARDLRRVREACAAACTALASLQRHLDTGIGVASASAANARVADDSCACSGRTSAAAAPAAVRGCGEPLAEGRGREDDRRTPPSPRGAPVSPCSSAGSESPTQHAPRSARCVEPNSARQAELARFSGFLCQRTGELEDSVVAISQREHDELEQTVQLQRQRAAELAAQQSNSAALRDECGRLRLHIAELAMSAAQDEGLKEQHEMLQSRAAELERTRLHLGGGQAWQQRHQHPVQPLSLGPRAVPILAERLPFAAGNGALNGSSRTPIVHHRSPPPLGGMPYDECCQDSSGNGECENRSGRSSWEPPPRIHTTSNNVASIDIANERCQ